MNIIIREYEDKDLDGVNNVLCDAFNHGMYLKNDSDIYKYIVAVDGDKVCGFLLLTRVHNPIKNKNYYIVDYVCVLSEYRGNAISDKMLDYAYSLVKKEKDVMYLQLVSDYHRIAAHKVYERNGFIKIEDDLYRKDIL